MIRVLVAEDSLTVRTLLVEMLGSDPEIVVAGEASDGVQAVEMAERLRPDLITMDIHMPRMDGLTATKEIMIRAPAPIIIVTSMAAHDVGLSLSATRAGALTVLPAPVDPRADAFEAARARLVATVKAMAAVKVVRRWRERGPAPAPLRPGLRAGGAAELVAVAASTGGPAALQRILMDLPRDFPAPLLIIQHISPGFVEALCAWLAASCALRVKLAEAGETPLPGTAYLAPDGAQLGVERGRVQLAPCDREGGHCPSADHLFASVAAAVGPAALGVVLTGMGSDGVDGLRRLRAAGGRVIAQDEESSVVYGMPREAARAGLVDAVLPLPEIAQTLVTLTQERSG